MSQSRQIKRTIPRSQLTKYANIMPSSTWRRLQAYCKENELRIGDVMEKAVMEYLNRMKA